MKEQIEKMACDMCLVKQNCNEPYKPIPSCVALKHAERAFEKGYRKQSDGEWIDRYNGKYANPIYVCSVCGKGTLLTPYINELNNMEMTQELSPFCPNCGAKMKGGAG